MAQRAMSTTELKEVTGYKRTRDLERCLTAAGVRWFCGKDGPWTTIDLINAAGGLQPAENDASSYPPDLRPVISQ